MQKGFWKTYICGMFIINRFVPHQLPQRINRGRPNFWDVIFEVQRNFIERPETPPLNFAHTSDNENAHVILTACHRALSKLFHSFPNPIRSHTHNILQFCTSVWAKSSIAISNKLLQKNFSWACLNFKLTHCFCFLDSFLTVRDKSLRCK